VTKGFGAVTTAAIASESAVVNVVGLVARRTFDRHLHVMLRLAMAVTAAEFSVCARQGEVGTGSVVELPEVPAVRVVTGRAVIAKLRLVYVLGPVTADALLRCIAKRTTRVAFLTGNPDVKADQREPRKVVVEFHVLAPVTLLVTRAAVASHPALMSVVNAVTASAVLCHLLLFERAAMAAMAIEIRMGPTQRKLGALLMVEFRNGPLLLAVTVGAIGTKPPRVSVGRRVTAIAIFR